MKKVWRKLASVLLALCVLTGTSGLVPAQAQMRAVAYENFGDLPERPWYINYLSYAFQEELLYGTSSTAFEPDRAISRGEAVTVLGRVHEKLTGETIPEAAGQPVSQPFEDVKPARFYTHYIAWAKEKGIVSGVDGGFFEPDRPVTMEELAVLFSNYLTYAGQQDKYEPLAETDLENVSEWAQEAVTAVSGFDIFQESHWDPRAEAKRGWCAAFFVRLYEKLLYPAPDKDTPYNHYIYRGQLTESGEYSYDSEPLLAGTETGTGSSKSWELLKDYQSYAALMERLSGMGIVTQEEREPYVDVTEETFENSRILVVEFRREELPRFQVTLSDFQYLNCEPSQTAPAEGDAAGDVTSSQPAEAPEPGPTGVLSFMCQGDTEDAVGHVFFFEVPKNFDTLTVNQYWWTEDFEGM